MTKRPCDIIRHGMTNDTEGHAQVCSFLARSASVQRATYMVGKHANVIFFSMSGVLGLCWCPIDETCKMVSCSHCKILGSEAKKRTCAKWVRKRASGA